MLPNIFLFRKKIKKLYNPAATKKLSTVVHTSIKIVTDFLRTFMINMNCDPQKGKSEPKS